MSQTMQQNATTNVAPFEPIEHYEAAKGKTEMKTLDEQLQTAQRRMLRLRRRFVEAPTRGAMNEYLDSLRTVEAAAHVWCVAMLPEAHTAPAEHVIEALPYIN